MKYFWLIGMLVLGEGWAWAATNGVSQRLLCGTLGGSLQHAAAGREAGWRVALVPVHWRRFEPNPGAIDEVYVQELRRKRDLLRELGYQLQLDLGVQYAPAWVFALRYGRYRNQYGESFQTRESGWDVPNVVFNAEVRHAVAGYFAEVFSRLGSDWDYVRLGCAACGELNFPQHNFTGRTNCYWGFDDLAQGKSPGLAAGLSPCPVPGWQPGAGSPGHASARAFVQWYLESLASYQDWQIGTVRRWYAGDLCLLYGSWGLRPGWLEAAIAGDLNGTTSAELNGEIQQGYDWTRMIRRLKDPKTIVYCTWLDATVQNQDQSDDNVADASRWSPARWLASLASEHPLKLRVWGENTGHNNRAVMHRTFDRVQQLRLMGMMWAFEPELFATPNPHDYATFADFAELIREHP
ncbi:MAG TPA: hypothetical protein VNZ22_13280 [Bacillota bacterium]|nr:hypothetical protein [Bacillota bacterium]